MMDKIRVFIDMDGVLVDFDGYAKDKGLTGAEAKVFPNAYRDMYPMPYAIESVGQLEALGYEVWVASKPPTEVPDACADKVRWVMHYLPQYTRRIILTPDKGLLGCAWDHLIDDRPHKANCMEFRGRLHTFKPETGWPGIMEFFNK